MPQTSSGSAQCQRRSEVRFECQAVVSIAALAHVYGMAAISATTASGVASSLGASPSDR